jgi:DNA repair exonuclease SbcCD nuclease subunit
MLFVADPHLGVKNDDVVFLIQSVNLFKTMIDYCISNDITEIVILGDFFDDRKSIGIKCINAAMEIANLLKNSKITVYLIIGNHDTFYKNEIKTHSLKIFEEYDNIHIINDTLIRRNIGYVSWNQSIDIDCEYLLGHFEINGFPVSENVISENVKYSVSDFRRFKSVYSGHYHIPSTNGNVTYLGSPYHLTFNDAGSDRGFYEFNDGILKFIKFNGIEYIKVTTEETINPDKIKNNVVKLIFKNDYGSVENQKIIDKIQSYEPLRFFIHFDVKRKEVEEKSVVAEVKSNKDILFDFIKIYDNPDYIDINMMMKIINEIIE